MQNSMTDHVEQMGFARVISPNQQVNAITGIPGQISEGTKAVERNFTEHGAFARPGEDIYIRQLRLNK